ncbi:DNA (cytosine-5-)-methyltransferase [Niveispirillum lacus]|uniref:Cytosine-specific methyltransferase n=1 Tax=Niveispirillum lacus TaxID=1981099 RepID=A0A255YQE2_9PROT|nr:DNA cytosine methyltransferase [Niveispirillum lacus]OYQ31429.1 DNA (cytosine-5-)-methyltransferase [Niveispirillum lacus]
MPDFYEFFAGGGMARAGLGNGWTCKFANDFSEMKADTYRSNWPSDDLHVGDVNNVTVADISGGAGAADLVWASFPCQDLSLAGNYLGIGHWGDKQKTRSGTFWPFWRLMRGLIDAGRAPKIIALENVYGAITSNNGKDFAAISSSFSGAGYRFGAMVIDAELFLPHSRPRLFFVGVRSDVEIPASIRCSGPADPWHPSSLVAAQQGISAEAQRKWVWWDMPTPPARTKRFADIIQDKPNGVDWHTAAETKALLGLMNPLHLAKVERAKVAGRRMVGGVYKRTRSEDGVKKQRAEVRFDDIAGCLRTPAGGSSRQSILVVDGQRVRSRLLSPREAARLMGLPDTYKLPAGYNDAYHVAGDGVAVPVVRHLAAHIFEPIVASSESATDVVHHTIAAE